MVEGAERETRYGVVGHPVDHSRSPAIHRLFARQTGIEISYELIDAPPESLEIAVRGFAAAGGKGLNITVPHKQAALKLCNSVGEAAQTAGAANTLSLTASGDIRGDNTDGIGLIRDLQHNRKLEVAGKRILVLGAGGAARGIVGPLVAEAPGELRLANRSRGRAEALAANWDSIVPCTFDELASEAPFDLVFNATSAGLKGDTPPFPTNIVDSTSTAYDLVYSLKDTPFVTWAKSAGARRAVQGWGMLVEQAAESFNIWHGKRPNTRAILTQLLGGHWNR
ncbi:MAG: shikimate dehydrogenase [Gammaproteobacteria bacterium]